MTVNFFSIPGGPSGTKGAQQTTGAQKSAKAEAKESAKFSSTLETATASTAAKETQDTERSARVNELKAQIQNGSYNPDLTKVASALLNHMSQQNG